MEFLGIGVCTHIHTFHRRIDNIWTEETVQIRRIETSSIGWKLYCWDISASASRENFLRVRSSNDITIPQANGISLTKFEEKNRREGEIEKLNEIFTKVIISRESLYQNEIYLLISNTRWKKWNRFLII